MRASCLTLVGNRGGAGKGVRRLQSFSGLLAAGFAHGKDRASGGGLRALHGKGREKLWRRRATGSVLCPHGHER